MKKTHSNDVKRDLLSSTRANVLLVQSCSVLAQHVFFWQLLLLFAQCKLQRNVHVLDLPDFGLNKAELETT